jgi:hypothetical protein
VFSNDSFFYRKQEDTSSDTWDNEDCVIVSSKNKRSATTRLSGASALLASYVVHLSDVPRMSHENPGGFMY